MRHNPTPQTYTHARTHAQTRNGDSTHVSVKHKAADGDDQSQDVCAKGARDKRCAKPSHERGEHEAATRKQAQIQAQQPSDANRKVVMSWQPGTQRRERKASEHKQTEASSSAHPTCGSSCHPPCVQPTLRSRSTQSQSAAPSG